MEAPKALIAVYHNGYDDQAFLAKKVFDAMTGDPVAFPSPPANLAALDNDRLALIAANLAYTATPSEINFATLQAAAKTVYTDLYILRDFVQGLVDENDSYIDQSDFILSSGFASSYYPYPS